jgi:hypothetical protein
MLTRNSIWASSFSIMQTLNGSLNLEFYVKDKKSSFFERLLCHLCQILVNSLGICDFGFAESTEMPFPGLQKLSFLGDGLFTNSEFCEMRSALWL